MTSMRPDSLDVEARAKALAQKIDALRRQIGSRILGQDRLIEDLTVGLLAGGHILLEGMPGLGKTRLVQTLAEGLGLAFARIQFTPDLMPADVTGTRIVEQRERGLEFRFQPGPLFANLVLADEINRATPKTQSALLEAMQEATVTVGETTHRLPKPFHVVATQNPIELEGTFPLPEAQLDRFLLHLVVERPDTDSLVAILEATTGLEAAPFEPVLRGDEVLEFQQLARQVLVSRRLVRYVAELVRATDPRDPAADDRTRRLVRYGASPRAGQAILLGAKVRALCSGRPSIVREDLDATALAALRHRIVPSFEAEEGSIVELLPSWQAVADRRSPD
jgi:MoxR-like ATPase